jgi:lipase
LIAAQGALTQATALTGLQAALGRSMTCPALPGHPGGPPWDATRDYHDQAFDGLLAALGTVGEGPVDLFGHSLGGTLALRLAVERPARVRSLILFEPVMFAAAPSAAQEAHWAEMAPFETAIAHGQHAEAAAIFTGFWGTGAPWLDLPPLVRKAITRMIPIIPATAPAIADDSHGIVARLASCPVPVLVLHQPAAPAIVTAIAQGLCARIPDAVVRQVSGRGGHMMPVVDPEAVAAQMSAFYAALPD